MGHTTAATLEKISGDIDTMMADYNESLDTIWMLVAAMLVFFMHAGFSLLESGCVRFKNTQNILAKNLCVVTLGFLSWYFVGYPLALGAVDDPGKMAGFTNFAMDGFWDDKSLFRVWFFQGCFCATGATIVSGAMAERTKLKGFGLYTVLMTSVIYPVVVYWGWSGNGIFNYTENGEGKSIAGPGLLDFAGSGIVHLVGGIGALCGAIIVGPRKGRFDDNHDESFEAHNIPFCVLGTFFLWFGWYGFNPGSTAAMHDAETAYTAAMAAVNTTLAPCIAGGVVFSLRAKVLPPKMKDVGAFCNGILAGLVSITAGCASVKHWEAIIIGAIGGCVYCGVSMLIQRLKIDDVVDAFAVHGACGFWGVMAPGFFGSVDIDGNGILHGGDQLLTQLFAAAVIAAWVAGLSLLVLIPLRLAGVLRQAEGLQKALEREFATMVKAFERALTSSRSSIRPPTDSASSSKDARPGEELRYTITSV